MSKIRDRMSPNLHTNHNHITITNITIYNRQRRRELMDVDTNRNK